MIALSLRPSFKQTLDYGSEEARGKIVDQVHQNEAKCEVKSFPGFICLRIPVEDRHFWSPRLNIGLVEDEAGKTIVTGTFGPNANMWSSYLYGYLIIGSVALFSGILGACQLSLGMSAWGMWIFTSMLVIGFVMFLAALVGQRLAAPESEVLEKIYEDAVGQKVEIH